MNPRTLEQRQMQTRTFDTTDEATLLSACLANLQDMDFNLDESESNLGVIVASKDRDAKDAGQVAMSFSMALLFGVYIPYDNNQKIRVSVVTSPAASDGPARTAVRVTFQRVVWDTSGQVSKLEALDDPKLYQGFFERLSKAVFLEAHQL
jgi:hypothetical protein